MDVGKPSALVVAGLVLGSATPAAKAYTIAFSDSDFSTAPVFSSVTTFAFDFDIAGPLSSGLVADPALADIQYSVSGILAPTPSGFPAFAFQLDHLFPLSPPITGTEFYALNASALPGDTLQFSVSPTANLSDGIQVGELDELPLDAAAGIGAGVVFHFNGREEGTGRYHPSFLQLRSDGTGILQNADNFAGINPATMALVDVDIGEEYITNLSFDPAALMLIRVPEPSRALLSAAGLGLLFARRRR